ncbi:MAG: winged helix-turn-helix domain-containing protein [Alphaproteobacteria bacterium]|nr:winged helix-turn-helix domain-containing protein [Alphaproteobacteria bacterium]
MELLALDPDAAATARAEGLVAPEHDGLDALATADALLVGPRGVARLRALRAVGVRTPAVWVGPSEMDRRAELEPLQDADPTVRDALERLAPRPPPPRVQVGTGVVDVERRRLLTGDDEIPLTQLQVDLVAYLAARPDRAVSREELLVSVWGMSPRARTRTIDMTVSRLRRLVEVDPDHPHVLVTLPSLGYRYLAPEVVPVSEGFFGRDSTLREARAALAGGARLVAVVGPPGAGKSTFARELCPAALWVPIGLDEPATAVATALDVTLSPEDPEGALLAALEGRGSLDLVLDGAEVRQDQVASLVAAWTDHLDVRVVVTTQRRMEGADLEVSLGPLDLEAAQALVVRALGREEPGLTDLLAGVDRLPLVLHLLAARLRSLPAAALSGVEDPHGWLGQHPDPVDARHRTLDAAVGWAWEGLPPQEREALTALSTVRGPLPVDVAVRVLDLPPAAAVARIDALADRSLVLAHDGGLHVLDSIRAFALAHGDPGPAQARLAAWLAGVAREALAQTPRAAVEALGPRLSDLLASWRHTAGDDRADLVLAADLVLQVRGGTSDRLALLDAVLPTVDGPAEAALLAARARALGFRDDTAPAETAWTAAIAAWTALGRAPEADHATVQLAHLLLTRGRTAEALDLVGPVREGAAPVAPLADSLARHIEVRAGRGDPAAHGAAMWRNLEALAASGLLLEAVGAAQLMVPWTFHAPGELPAVVRRLEELARDVPFANIRLGVAFRVAELASFEGRYADALAALDGSASLHPGARPEVRSAALALLSTTCMHLGDTGRARRVRAEHAALLRGSAGTQRVLYEQLEDVIARLAEGDVDGAEALAAALAVEVDRLDVGLLRPQMPLVGALCALCAGLGDLALERLAPVEGLALTASSPHQRDAIGVAGAWLAGDLEEHGRRAAALVASTRASRVHSAMWWRALADALVDPGDGRLADLADGRPTHTIVRLVARAVVTR